MEEQKIQSNLKKLVVVFLIVCLIIGGFSRYFFQSVSDLYTESVQRVLEERALQYKKSFLFKTNADLQTLRAMACMLEGTATESISTENTGKILSNLWEAGSTAGFIRLCYFDQQGVGLQLTARSQEFDIRMDQEDEEMQSIIQRALQGETLCSQAFYDTYLRCNVVGYASPVYTHGEISGVLTCVVSTEVYADILSSIGAVSDVGAAAVLSADGKVIASTRTHQTQGFYDLSGSIYLNEEASDAFKQALTLEGTQFFEFEFDGMTLHACVMPMDICSDKIVIVDSDRGVSDAALGVVEYAHMIDILFGVTSILFVIAVFYMNRRYNKQLLQVAYHDRLTGAYNRYKFFQLLDENRKNHRNCTVVAINIRKFKIHQRAVYCCSL